jgi:hypothetical protein
MSFSAEKSPENLLQSATSNKLFGSANNIHMSPSVNESKLRMMTPQTADVNASQIKSSSTL